jgi:hypothetical protein
MFPGIVLHSLCKYIHEKEHEMKFSIIAAGLLFVLLNIGPLSAADTNDSQGSARSQDYSLNSLADDLLKSGLHKNKIMVWGGAHKHLYGYTDKRYKSQTGSSAEDRKRDQGDYISVNAMTGGMELFMTDFSDVSSILKDGKFGMNVSYYHHDRIPQRNLYAVPLHGIGAETVPATESRMIERWWMNTGFFIGADKKWFEIDVGLTVKTTIINEKSREKLDPSSTPSNPTYVKTKGRGAIFDDSSIIGNFYFRLGLESRPHFVFSVYREDYDPVYGIAQVKLCFPISKYFEVDTGGYVRKTQSIFIEPIVKVAGLELGVKTGLIINYGNDAKMKTGIKDSVYGSIKMAYAW